VSSGRGLVVSLALSRDGEQIASGWHDGRIRFFDARTGKLVRTLDGHKGAVEALALSPDGKRLVSGCAKGKLYLWKEGKAKELTIATALAVQSAAFTGDGKRFAAGCALNDGGRAVTGVVVVYDEEGKPLGRAESGELTGTVAFNPSGDAIAAGTYTLKLYDVAQLLRAGKQP
jgi:WD40 repeat protein